MTASLTTPFQRTQCSSLNAENTRLVPAAAHMRSIVLSTSIASRISDDPPTDKLTSGSRLGDGIGDIDRVVELSTHPDRRQDDDTCIAHG
jgi:hypothetical protein